MTTQYRYVFDAASAPPASKGDVFDQIGTPVAVKGDVFDQVAPAPVAAAKADVFDAITAAPAPKRDVFDTVAPSLIPPGAKIETSQPSVWQRIKDVFTSGIPRLSTRTASNPKYGQM